MSAEVWVEVREAEVSSVASKLGRGLSKFVPFHKADTTVAALFALTPSPVTTLHGLPPLPSVRLRPTLTTPTGGLIWPKPVAYCFKVWTFVPSVIPKRTGFPATAAAAAA